MAQNQPLFTIAVTTYDRIELLRQTLESVLKQGFSDFEILIGNDNPGRNLDMASLGLADDSRVRIINRPSNLRELGNMNDLLRLARGRYFTWLADDDLYAPNFLKTVSDLIQAHSDIPCVLTSFSAGEFPPSPFQLVSGKSTFFSGGDFLRSYWRGDAKTVSVMGIFLTTFLRDMGGLEDVSRDGQGMFCEYMLLVRIASSDQVAYIDAPLIFYRQHAASWSNFTQDLDQYLRASHHLIADSIPVLLKLEGHFRENLTNIMVFAVKRCIGLIFRRKDWTYAHLFKVLRRFSEYTVALKGTKRAWSGRLALAKTWFWGCASIAWFSFKRLAPAQWVVRAAAWRDRNIKGFVK